MFTLIEWHFWAAILVANSDPVLGYEYESQNWDSDEIPATERDLADDAPWKQIQKNTFTRWCNEHLKVANMRINTLETDLSDGLRLIALIEVIIW